MELSYCSTVYIWGSSGPNCTLLEHNSQHNSFLSPHHLVIPGYVGVLGTKAFSSHKHCQAGWGYPCTMYFLLCGWQTKNKKAAACWWARLWTWGLLHPSVELTKGKKPSHHSGRLLSFLKYAQTHWLWRLGSTSISSQSFSPFTGGQLWDVE